MLGRPDSAEREAGRGALAPSRHAALCSNRRGSQRRIRRTSPEAILTEATHNLYDRLSLDELVLAPILTARTLVETEPNYSCASTRLLLDKLRC
jgi:ribonucleoside-diphosphate reductase alpha chain